MNDLVLYIFRQDKEKSANIQYTFVLEEPNLPPVIGNRSVQKRAWEAVTKCYADVSGAYRRFELDGNGLKYKNDVSEIIGKLSEAIRVSLWPKSTEVEGKAFAERFAEQVAAPTFCLQPGTFCMQPTPFVAVFALNGVARFMSVPSAVR